jgi:hypothetical protein
MDAFSGVLQGILRGAASCGGPAAESTAAAVNVRNTIPYHMDKKLTPLRGQYNSTSSTAIPGCAGLKSASKKRTGKNACATSPGHSDAIKNR